MKTLEGPSSDIYCVSSLQDALVAAGHDKVVYVFQRGQTTKLRGHQHSIKTLVCQEKRGDSTPPLIVSGSWDMTIIIWDFATLKMAHQLMGHENKIRGLDISLSPHPCIISGGDDKQLIVWSSESGTCLLKSINHHSNIVTCVSILEGSGLVASGSSDKTIELWSYGNAVSGLDSEKWTLKGHTGRLLVLRSVVRGSLDRTAKSGDGMSGGTAPPEDKSLSYHLCSLAGDKTVRVWHVSYVDGRAYYECHNRFAFDQALTCLFPFTSGEQQLLFWTCDSAGTLIQWRIPTRGAADEVSPRDQPDKVSQEKLTSSPLTCCCACPGTSNVLTAGLAGALFASDALEARLRERGTSVVLSGASGSSARVPTLDRPMSSSLRPSTPSIPVGSQAVERADHVKGYNMDFRGKMSGPISGTQAITYRPTSRNPEIKADSLGEQTHFSVEESVSPPNRAPSSSFQPFSSSTKMPSPLGRTSSPGAKAKKGGAVAAAEAEVEAPAAPLGPYGFTAAGGKLRPLEQMELTGGAVPRTGATRGRGRGRAAQSSRIFDMRRAMAKNRAQLAEARIANNRDKHHLNFLPESQAFQRGGGRTGMFRTQRQGQGVLTRPSQQRFYSKPTQSGS